MGSLTEDGWPTRPVGSLADDGWPTSNLTHFENPGKLFGFPWVLTNFDLTQNPRAVLGQIKVGRNLGKLLTFFPGFTILEPMKTHRSKA